MVFNGFSGEIVDARVPEILSCYGGENGCVGM